MRLSSHGDLLVVGTEAGKVQIWNLVKPVLVSSFYLDKRPMKITSKDKIRSVSFTIDERYVVISSKHKLAYYSTVDLKKEKSKSVFDDFRIDLMVRNETNENEFNFEEKKFLIFENFQFFQNFDFFQFFCVLIGPR